MGNTETASNKKNGMQKLIERYNSLQFKKVLSESSGLIGFILVTLIIIVAIFAPQLAPYPPNKIDVLNRLTGPNLQHLLGTDNLGRDTLSRLIFGARIALTVSLSSVSFGVVLALVFGLMAGYSSQTVGNLFVILFDTIKSFPALIFAITIMALIGPSIVTLIIVIGITTFPGYARLIRAETLRVKEEEYILAAKALGCSKHRIMFRHILPNAIGPLFIQAAMDIPVVITYEAALSFLGLGVPPPAPSWGAILRTGYLYIRISPWLVIFGGIVLVLATLGFTLFGEALRDTLDPKLRKIIQ